MAQPIVVAILPRMRSAIRRRESLAAARVSNDETARLHHFIGQYRCRRRRGFDDEPPDWLAIHRRKSPESLFRAARLRAGYAGSTWCELVCSIKPTQFFLVRVMLALGCSARRDDAPARAWCRSRS